MARNTGTFEFPSNFEVQKAGPLDARTQTGLKSELTGLPFAYKGMIVSVTDDSNDNNGTYTLNDTDGSVLLNWSKIASTTVESMVYSGSILTLTMSDGATLTTTISSAAAPSGAPGASSATTVVGGTSGTISFISASE